MDLLKPFYGKEVYNLKCNSNNIIQFKYIIIITRYYLNNKFIFFALHQPTLILIIK